MFVMVFIFIHNLKKIYQESSNNSINNCYYLILYDNNTNIPFTQDCGFTLRAYPLYPFDKRNIPHMFLKLINSYLNSGLTKNYR